MLKDRVVVATLVGWLFVGVLAAQGSAPTWMPMQQAVTPGMRASHAMVYVDSSDAILMFGGDVGNNAGGSLSSESWEWKNAQWTQVGVAIYPMARSNHRMAYDAVRQRVVLYGGTDGAANLGDTWEWDGSGWAQVSTSNSPGPLRNHAMCFHAGLGAVLLFGGEGGGYSNQTWAFNGGDWVQISTSVQPSARIWHAMAYDVARGVAVVYGGSTGGAQPTDTWEFNGTDWQQVGTSGGPGSLINHQMQYDSVGGRILLHAGEGSSATWKFDGATWTLISTQGTPPARGYFASAFDVSRGSLVVHGGWNGGSVIFDDPWEFVDPSIISSPANAVSFGSGCGSPALHMQASAPPLINSVGSATISNAPLPFGGVTLGFSDTVLGGLPILPFSLTGLGMPGCFLWHSNEISGLPIVPVSPGVLSFSAAIPGNVSLLGTHVYLQAYCVDPNASPRKLITSNGVDWTIGNQ